MEFRLSGSASSCARLQAISNRRNAMSNDKTALVLGATGGVGGTVAEALLNRGWRVRGLSRRPRAARAADPIQWIGGDAMEAKTVADAAAGTQLIVHAVNPPGYRDWEQAGPAHDRKHHRRRQGDRRAHPCSRQCLQLRPGRPAARERDLASAPAHPQGRDPGADGTAPGPSRRAGRGSLPGRPRRRLLWRAVQCLPAGSPRAS